jgi:5'-nucleotidase
MVKIHHPLRILISNDDGVHATGIKVLHDIASHLSDDVWVVAPETEQSGAGHSLTLRRPLRIRKISERRFAVDGTPTDCMMLGIKKVLNDLKPSLVLSGINHGANLGEDVTYSGTVAAAMEATLLGIPSISLSLVTVPQQPIKWSTPEQLAPDLMRSLIKEGWPKNVFININFPNLIASSVKGVKIVKQGLRVVNDDLIEWRDPRGSPFYWIGGVDRPHHATESETDLEAISQGYISVSPLHLDLTHNTTLKHLKKIFEDGS